MNKISKILLAVALGIALGYGVNAAKSYMVWDVALAQNGQVLPHPGFEGKSFTRFSSITETAVCTGKCLLYDVILTSGAATDYAILLDSAPALGGSGIFSKVMFSGASYSLGSGSLGFPVVTTYGITAQLSSITNGGEITVIYKDLD